MIICLGPFCIPIWNIILFIFALLNPLKNLLTKIFKKNHPEKQDKNLGEVSQIKSNNYEYNIEKKIINQEIIELTDLNEWELCKSIGSRLDLPIIIDFYATWCEPCKRIYPKFLEYSKEYNGIFIKVDYEKFSSFASEMNIISLPTFQIWTLSKDSYILSNVLEKSDTNLLEKMISNNFKKKRELEMINDNNLTGNL